MSPDGQFWWFLLAEFALGAGAIYSAWTKTLTWFLLFVGLFCWLLPTWYTALKAMG